MKTLPSKSSQTGLTLLELIIASSISAVVIGIALLTLKSTQNFFEVTTVESHLSNQTQSVLDKISQELKSSYWEKIKIRQKGRGVSYAPVIGWDTGTHQLCYSLKKHFIFWKKSKGELQLVKLPTNYSNLSKAFIRENTEVLACNVRNFSIEKIETPRQERISILLEVISSGDNSTNQLIIKRLRREIFIPREPKFK